MMAKADIELPRNISADITEKQVETMVDVSLVLEPLWENALGKEWKSAISREKIKGLYQKM